MGFDLLFGFLKIISVSVDSHGLDNAVRTHRQFFTERNKKVELTIDENYFTFESRLVLKC